MSGKSIIPPAFVLLWATGFIGARYAMPWAEPFTFLALRFALAFVVLAALAHLLGARATTWREAVNAMLAGGLMHGVYLGGVFWAVHRGLPAGLSALIVGLQPLITALMAGPILGERILPRHWAGLAAGFAGVVIVLLPKLGAAASAVTWPTLTASIVSVIGMSAGTILQKRLGAASNLIAATSWQYVGAAILMAIASLAFESRTIVLSGELIFAMAWLVLVLSVGAIILLMVMIREGAMARVSSLFYLVPAVTALMAWLLFDETLSVLQVAGMALATFGVALATSGNSDQPATRARA